MQTIATAAELRRVLPRDRPVAFVPTMGALHAGHAALVDAAAATHPVVVASVFVNPTQFNEAADLSAYPRTPQADADLLRAHGCHFLYRPTVADVYPKGQAVSAADRIDFGLLTASMEGANRPGHFGGVAQVVSRLLAIVEPTTLFLGQKDYQQVAVVRRMIRELGLPVAIEVVPTVRAADGLALSSRNRRLNPTQRIAAAAINRHLAAVTAGLAAGWPPAALEQLALDAMNDAEHLEPEYVHVFDGETLLPYGGRPTRRETVVAAAVHVGPVRLIDNRIVKWPSDDPTEAQP